MDPETAPHALLLTGVPGVGKTTVIRRLARRLTDRRLGGFYTEERREAGVRQGFQLIGFNGVERLIAHVNFSKSARVGKYGVDVTALDEMAEALLTSDTAAELYLVDEIGKMECCSVRFVAAMRALLARGVPLVATVARHGGGLIAEVKQRPDGVLWEVTRANRDELPARIEAWLAGHAPASRTTH